MLRRLVIFGAWEEMMASDTIVLWVIALFCEWFFLAKADGEDFKRNVGLENLGWFLIFMTSALGIAIIESGESAMAFIVGGIGMLISLIYFVSNINSD